jgi:hypothetical protein
MRGEVAVRHPQDLRAHPLLRTAIERFPNIPIAGKRKTDNRISRRRCDLLVARLGPHRKTNSRHVEMIHGERLSQFLMIEHSAAHRCRD